MTEQNPEVAATETESATAKTDAKPDAEQKPTETVDFWKQKAREQEKRAKDNADAAKRLAELEDSQKSETQRLTDRVEAAEKRATDADGMAMRLQVALEKGLTLKQAQRLVGSTAEELAADAEELLETFKPAETKTETPTVDLDLGARPGAVASSDPRTRDLQQIEADIKAAKRP